MKPILKQSIGLLFAACGALYVFTVTRSWGLGLSPDSVIYISAARNLLAGKGLVTFDGSVMTLYPPLYPAALAMASRVSSLDPMNAAMHLNLILFAAIIYLSATLFQKHNSGRGHFFILSAFLMASVFSGPLLKIACMAWSECLYLALFVLFYICLIKYLSTNKPALLFPLALIGALACLTRYVGLTLIISGTICLLAYSDIAPAARLRRAFLFALLAVLPLSLFMARNYYLTRSLTGPRYPSIFTLHENIILMAQTVSLWFFPWSYKLFFAALVGAAIIVIYFLNKKILFNPVSKLFVMFSIIYLIIYAAFILIASTFTAHDRIGDRLLSPIYLPVLFIAFAFIRALFDASPQRQRLIVTIVFSLGFAALLSHMASQSWAFHKNASEHGIGYSASRWKESQSIKFLQSLEAPSPIYSNDPFAVYILANKCAVFSPLKRQFNSRMAGESLKDLSLSWPQWEGSRLVWFSQINSEYFFKPDELAAISNLTLTNNLNDALIYSISKKTGR